MFVVTGASGQLGQLIVKNLLARMPARLVAAIQVLIVSSSAWASRGDPLAHPQKRH